MRDYPGAEELTQALVDIGTPPESVNTDGLGTVAITMPADMLCTFGHLLQEATDGGHGYVPNVRVQLPERKQYSDFAASLASIPVPTDVRVPVTLTGSECIALWDFLKDDAGNRLHPQFRTLWQKVNEAKDRAEEMQYARQ